MRETQKIKDFCKTCNQDSQCMQIGKYIRCLKCGNVIRTIKVDSAGTLGGSCRTITPQIKTALEIEQELKE